MRKIIVGPNDGGQRIDRFLKKYFKGANLSFIYKNLRKKNIKLNGARAKEDELLKEGDEIYLYLSDETIEKFLKEEDVKKSQKLPKILYEDENICLLEKGVNILSHNDQRTYQDNMLDRFVDYLILKGDYNPRLENSFRPSICNRLDRNTSGILIGAKNAKALREINEAIRERKVDKFYLALVRGRISEDFEVNINLRKNESNLVFEDREGKKSLTRFHPLITKNDYSLLKVNLITGRTHQIRASLAARGLYLIGDRKYGSGARDFIDYQALHNYEIKFNMDGEFSYLNDKKFTYLPDNKLIKALEELFSAKIGDLVWQIILKK